MPGSDQRHLPQEVQIALLQREVEDMRGLMRRSDERIDSLEKERDKALVWGISALGTALIGLVVWIGNFVATHLSIVKGG